LQWQLPYQLVPWITAEALDLEKTAEAGISVNKEVDADKSDDKINENEGVAGVMQSVRIWEQTKRKLLNKPG
jgi:hypothetical protein